MPQTPGAAHQGGACDSNPQLDALLEQALAIIDGSAHKQLLRTASQFEIGNVGVVPLHYEVAAWVFRKELIYVVRADGFTRAASAIAASH